MTVGSVGSLWSQIRLKAWPACHDSNPPTEAQDALSVSDFSQRAQATQATFGNA